MQDVTITCLLVASKAEDTYKKIKPILIAACRLLNPNFIGFDENTEVLYFLIGLALPYLLKALLINRLLQILHRNLKAIERKLRVMSVLYSKPSISNSIFCIQKLSLPYCWKNARTNLPQMPLLIYSVYPFLLFNCFTARTFASGFLPKLLPWLSLLFLAKLF